MLIRQNDFYLVVVHMAFQLEEIHRLSMNSPKMRLRKNRDPLHKIHKFYAVGLIEIKKYSNMCISNLFNPAKQFVVCELM